MANNNGNTFINYEAARTASQNIDTYRKTMQSIFDDSSLTMLKTVDPQTNEGKHGEALKNQFDSLKGTFTQYTDRVAKLKTILDENIRRNEETESKQAAAAEELPNN